MTSAAPRGLLAGAGLLAISACGTADPSLAAVRLGRVEAPTLLQDGSPLRVYGVGLAGRALLLTGAGVEVHARVDAALAEASIATADELGDSGAIAADSAARAARVEAVAAGGTADAALQRACVVDETFAGAAAAPCVDLVGVQIGPLPPLTAPSLGPSGGAHNGDAPEWTLALGGSVGLVADGLLLPGEGSCWLEVAAAIAGADLPAPLTATLRDVSWDRRVAVTRLAIDWSGPLLTKTQVRGRIWRQPTGGGALAGPWSGPLSLTMLEAPLVSACPADGCELRRARTMALTAASCRDGALVRLRGVWSMKDVVIADWSGDGATLPLLRGHDGACRVGLPSAWALAEPWRVLPRGARFVGEAQLVSASGAASAPAAVSLRRGGDRQALVVRWDAGAAVGFGHFGLGHHQTAIRARATALVAGHFAEVALDVLAKPPVDAIEWMQVGVFGEDPNGMGLLGLDPSEGKDVGNRWRGERLDGFDAEAFSAGRGAFGGVFLVAFLRFSPTLWPGGAGVDAAFDGLFGAFAPALGGTPAPPILTGAAAPAALAAAIEALAQLLAGTVSHEAGHALGLAASADGYHHPNDNPRWRMDAGSARPFVERAALGGQGEIWGPADAAALLVALPP